MSEPGPDHIPETALAWLDQGKRVALASVVETWGSAPRPAGSQMVISSLAEMAGSVSGGCVEGAVVSEAQDALADGQPRLLQYGVSDNQAFGVGLACGGTIRILVEPLADDLDRQLLEHLVGMRAKRQPVIYQANLTNRDRRLILPGQDQDADRRFVGDSSGLDGDRFRIVHNPPLRLVVVGAVHIAQFLLPMARLVGYDTCLIDPRDAFSSAARFPGQMILRDWPDTALQDLGIDGRTAVVTLTHDPKLDDPAIKTALAAPVFYLGCLGSTRTHAKRVERLRLAGIDDGQIARIHAPVGADIGSRLPAEIAVSILAQITERLRRPQTRPGAAGIELVSQPLADVV